MTTQNRYNEGMNLLSIQGQGALYTLSLLLVCIVLVFAVKLAIVGYRALGKKLPPEAPKKPKPKPEQVYFIVERKKKRAKAEYSEPRRIQFK